MIFISTHHLCILKGLKKLWGVDLGFLMNLDFFWEFLDRNIQRCIEKTLSNVLIDSKFTSSGFKDCLKIQFYNLLASFLSKMSYSVLKFQKYIYPPYAYMSLKNKTLMTKPKIPIQPKGQLRDKFCQAWSSEIQTADIVWFYISGTSLHVFEPSACPNKGKS